MISRVLVVSVLAMLFALGNALAEPDGMHDIDPHDWITAGHYSARDNGQQHCCDQKYHCRTLTEDQVETVDENSWRIISTGEVFKRDEMGNYPSQDGKFWECRWSSAETIARRCFFHAGAGM